MNKLSLALAALGLAAVAAPASATVEVGSSTGCANGPLAPTADKCAGYFSGNTMSGQKDSVAEQQAAINQLIGAGQYTVDWNALQAAGKIVTGSNLNDLNKLLATAGGQVILGFHWGNVPGPQGNVSAIYLWNNVKAGDIRLTDTQGYSNAVLYRAAAVAAPVPEPGTWALMLIGFGAAGASLRRRRSNSVIPQFA
ncbi:PEPxxWA-CTERM sorting domain-containing protein [Sphingomonas sp. LHG3443-2]|uniref:PEPxxWA-CTERM sorting domain-containing protein n=1 Tax=Sphingomonas sp. LHG3443-2 TaxID=2804639 RepID=UPI003CF7E951